jgi:hypothetical protein
MNLNNPITIQPPTITRSNGEVRVQKPITINELDYTIFDNIKRKTCMVRIIPCPYPLVLWKNTDYTNIGDYTTAQVENRINELLGNDIKSGLENLFVPPSRDTLR